MSRRLAAMGVKEYQGLAIKAHSRRLDAEHAVFNGTIRLLPERLEDPMHWRKPCRIFVNSMSDLFHPDVPFDFVDKVFAVMALCPQHSFQVLTKRPERMFEYMKDWQTFDNRTDAINAEARIISGGKEDCACGIDCDLLPNVWLGVSVEDQQTADERIPALLETPAAVRWVSVEPMLGKVDFASAPGLNRMGAILPNWIVIGAESRGTAAGRECKMEWIESIAEQCRAANVPVFVKQIQIGNRIVKDIEQFPSHLQIQEYPK